MLYLETFTMKDVDFRGLEPCCIHQPLQCRLNWDRGGKKGKQYWCRVESVMFLVVERWVCSLHTVLGSIEEGESPVVNPVWSYV